MRFDFEWDIKKARNNTRKHKVSFERAATVFRDPNMRSVAMMNIVIMKNGG
jgi:uncharacterized protein